MSFSKPVKTLKKNPTGNAGISFSGLDPDKETTGIVAGDSKGGINITGDCVSILGKVSYQSQGSERAESLLFTQSFLGLITDMIPSTMFTPLPKKGVNINLIKGMINAIKSAAEMASLLG